MGEPQELAPDDEPPAGGGQGRNQDVDFRGEKRSNQTHRSTTDPDARLKRKGGEGAKLCCSANVLMENRNGLIVDTEVVHASGTAEWDGALAMLDRLAKRGRRRTLGADKGYDAQPFVRGTRPRLHSARRAEHVEAPERDRRPDHEARGLPGEPAEAQAGGAGLRLGQDGRPAPQTASSRKGAGELDLRVHVGRLQPGEDANAAHGRSVPVSAEVREHSRGPEQGR